MATSKTIVRTFAAIVLVVMTVVTTLAFRNKTENKNPIVTTATNYHYKSTSTDINDLRDMDNWEANVSTSPECGGGSELPCVIPFTPSGTETNFQTFLNNRDLPALILASTSQKSD